MKKIEDGRQKGVKETIGRQKEHKETMGGSNARKKQWEDQRRE